MVLGEWRPKYFDIQMVRGESCSIYLVERSSSSNSTIYSIVRGGWASGDDSLPSLMQTNDREQTGGEVRVGKKDMSDMSFGSI